MTAPSCEAWLAALGRCLDRLRIRDAFLLLDADGVTLTTVRGATPLATVSYGRRRLARLATSKRAGAHRPGHPPTSRRAKICCGWPGANSIGRAATPPSSSSTTTC